MLLASAITDAAYTLVNELRGRSLTITTVESCTGGLVGAAITAISGSSGVYPGGVVTYSNEQKQNLVGVSQATLESHGAVSSETATEMARGGRSALNTDFAVAITGIAGPSGGTSEKPVGTVWICVAGVMGIDSRRFVFQGNRNAIRMCSVYSALTMAAQQLNGELFALANEHEQVCC